MNVTVNIRQGQAPAYQKRAWEEFLDMLVERAEALKKQEAGTTNTSLKGGIEELSINDSTAFKNS